MPDDRADIEARYRATYDEFAALLDNAVATADLQEGRKVRGDRDSYGEKIFIKLVCHGLSSKRLSPSSALVSAACEAALRAFFSAAQRER
jgi:hypothetical protein